MRVADLRAHMRFDSGGWRRFAELGCVYGPEWWKRASPPVIAAIIYAIARRNRRVVRRNQRGVLGRALAPVEHWRAYRVFASFARAMTESMEQWGPRPMPLRVETIGQDIFDAALAEEHGLIVATGAFGSWEAGARMLSTVGRPVHMVMAHEANPTVREFVHRMRSRHGVGVIYSDQSPLGGVPILQALRRREVVCMKIESRAGLAGAMSTPLFGQPAYFQSGPFEVARVARAPIVPVFVLRRGLRHYELHITGRHHVRTPADVQSALAQTVASYERLIRAHPAQWQMFDDVWPEPGADAGTRADYEIVPQAVGLRRR
jgi:KDO2-lipid IV(A) lauroyltransferase